MLEIAQVNVFALLFYYLTVLFYNSEECIILNNFFCFVCDVLLWGVAICCFFQAEDGIRYLVRSRGLGDVYKRQGGP